MPVIIRDFSVETNGQSTPEPSTPSAVPQSLSPSQMARQVAELIKAAQERVCRLRAD
jgi:hypothetical protein